MSVQIGPFDLHGPLGEGGMGVVYKGVHRAQQVPVAIKVVMEDMAREERYLRAFELLETRDGLMKAMGLGLADKRLIEGWLLKGRLFRLQERLDEAADWTTRAQFHAQANAWDDALSRALVQQALLAIQLGHLEEASRYLDRALAGMDSPDLQKTRGTALVARGGVAIRQGDTLSAHWHYGQALRLFDTLGLPERCVWVKVHIAYIHFTDEAWDKALTIYDEALAFYSPRHNRHMIAHILNDRGDILRYQGNLAAAEADYRRALSINQTIGTSNTSVVQLNLAQVLTQRGAFAPARAILDEVTERLTRTGQQGLVGISLIYRLPCLAHEGDWDTWDADLAAPTDPARAIESLKLARRIWDQLGRRERITEIDTEIAALRHAAKT